MRPIAIFFIFLLCIPSLLLAKQSKEGLFSGRISKISREASILRIKINFSNMKYLNRKDQFQIWNLNNSNIKCKGYILGKSPDYLLVKLPEYSRCSSLLTLGVGKYFMFFSQDLVNNIKMGRELISILLKKRMAVQGSMSRKKKTLDTYMDRVEIINKKYKILRDKLELEWRDELAALEEDNLVAVRNYKELERRLNEVDFKIEKYQVKDENLSKDKWSLDSRLYFKK